MSNLIFRVFLTGIPWKTIIRRLGLNERARGVGDGKVEGYPYTLIHRDDEILLVLRDYEPREKCQEVAKKLLSRLMPKSEIEIVTIGYASSQCNYCLKPTPLPYKCYRCAGWYCEAHRLPEKHKCPDGKQKAERTAKRIKPKKEKEKEKVIVTEIPCG